MPAKRKIARRRKAPKKHHKPNIAKHGKTAAERRKYIEYVHAKRQLAKEFFG